MSFNKFFWCIQIYEIDLKWSHQNAQFLINKLSQKSRIEITRLQKNVNIET